MTLLTKCGGWITLKASSYLKNLCSLIASKSLPFSVRGTGGGGGGGGGLLKKPEGQRARGLQEKGARGYDSQFY